MNTNLQQIKELSTLHKIKTGVGLLPYIENNSLSLYPLLYISSHLDLEFPLILQAKKIIMLDPCFARNENIGSILQKVINYDSGQPEVNHISSWHTHITFNFDFGRGLEKVHLDLIARKYQDYEIVLPLSCILEFNSPLEHTLYKKDILQKLMIGGLIINNQQSPLKTTKISFLDMLQYGNNVDKIEDVKANKLGLETIRIPNVPYAIYKKTSNSPKLLELSAN